MAGRGTVLAALLLVCWIAVSVRADTAPGAVPVPDVRLLIDSSGSMKQTDPENLRAPSLELILRLLPDGARAGVWIFGEEVAELVPLRVIDARWRQGAAEAVAAIDDAGQRSDIPAALAAAVPDSRRMDPAYRTSVVLLSDGKVEIAESPVANASAARRVLTGLARELGAAGIPVHTIALTDEADWQFLRSLARVTGGIAEKAETAGELPAIFLQALELVAPIPRVPLTGNHFQIDDSVREFTVLVFAGGDEKPVALVDPAGDRIRSGTAMEGVEWFRNSQFILVTVTAPLPGAWKLEAPAGPGTRLMVMADLQLEVDPLPTSLPAGRQPEMGLRLREGVETITDPEVLAAFPITVEVERASGEGVVIDVSGSYPFPADGDYRVLLPVFDKPGRYRVLARVDARTMQREVPMYVEVEPTPETSAIVTRGTEVAQQDLRLPLLTAGLVLAVFLIALWWILRRRRRRRLELWQRRGRVGEAIPAASDPLPGDRGGVAPPERHD